MAKRKVLLAKEYGKVKVRPTGWWMSEKLDGYRGVWIPWARGKMGRDVPFADKDVLCTGLFSSSGQVINAPAMWLDTLPTNQCLDGELFLGRGKFQSHGFIRAKTPTAEWNQVKFHVFDIPFTSPRMYEEIMAELKTYESTFVVPVPHEKLPVINPEKTIMQRLDEVSDAGGEGLMLRAPLVVWENGRSNGLLKVKKLERETGVCVDYQPGQGKYTGMIGSLIVECKGERFKVSGLTDAERNEHWIGRTVTFKYLTKTDSGKIREGRIAR